MTAHDEVNVAGAALAFELSMLLDGLDLKQREEARRRRVEKARMPDGLKRCSKCGKIKTLESFYRYHRSSDGHLGQCKKCFLKARDAR